MNNLERAEIYLRKLSSGLNPLDDSVLAESDVCRQERISRCLLFVADFLRKQTKGSMVSNTSAAVPKKQKSHDARRELGGKSNKELVLNAEVLAKFEFTDDSVSISSIVRNLNNLLPPDSFMEPLVYADVAEILSQDGLLTKQANDSGRSLNLPTAEGEVLGFAKGEAEIRGRHAVFTKCSRNAQMYILNNIQRCVAMANERLSKRIASASSSVDSTEKAAAREKRVKFSLTEDEKLKYPLDVTPVPVTEIARRLNGLIPPGSNIQQIYFKTIRDWFVREGYLQQAKDVLGKVSTTPSEKGTAAGIITEKRIGKNGESYDAILYGVDVQKIVLEHVNEM